VAVELTMPQKISPTLYTQRRCNKCHLIKTPIEFIRPKSHRESKICNECNRDHNRANMRTWRERNKEKNTKNRRDWVIKNKEKYQNMCRQWNKDHPNNVQEWRKNNPDNVKAISKRSNEKRRAVLQNRLSDAIAGRIYSCIKRGAKQGRHWECLVSFTLSQLKTHLEKRFDDKMSWDNYGAYWHIDHKIPVAAFNFNVPEDLDFKRCWALNNLQPLESKENQRKSAKIYRPFQPTLAIGL
jgi:hypothetical protein